MHEHRFIPDTERKNRFWVCQPDDESRCDISLPMIAGGDLVPEYYPGMPTITQLEDELRTEIYGQPIIYVALRRFFVEMKWFCIEMWTGRKRDVALPPEYFGLAVSILGTRELRKFSGEWRLVWSHISRCRFFR